MHQSFNSKVLTCRCLQFNKGVGLRSLPSRVWCLQHPELTGLPSSLSVCLWPSSLPSACSQSLYHSHSKHDFIFRQQVVVGGGNCVSVCGCVCVGVGVCVCVCGGAGSAHHAQQINEPVSISHRKAQFSRDIRWGETNHLHHCWAMAARLFKPGFVGEEKKIKGLLEIWSQRKTLRDIKKSLYLSLL